MPWIFVALVVGPYFIARLWGRNVEAAGRFGIAMVFFLGALGHFAQTEPMSQMIPPRVPYRYEITLLSGLLEVGLGVAAAMNFLARSTRLGTDCVLRVGLPAQRLCRDRAGAVRRS